MKIKTTYGSTSIEPIYCEITGDILGWRTLGPLSLEEFEMGVTPAYVSLKVVDASGKQLIDTSHITTF